MSGSLPCVGFCAYISSRFFTHRSDTRFVTAISTTRSLGRSIRRTLHSDMFAAASLLLFSDNQVRFAQNNALREQEVSCHAPEP